MNNVALFGRLVRDPELRYTQTNIPVVRFTVAVDRRYSRDKRQEMEASNQPTADFISCTAWNKTAELISNYFTKGSQIALTGRIQTGSYEREGRKVYTTDVVVSNIDFVGSQTKSAGQSQRGTSLGGMDLPVNSAYDNEEDEDAGFFPIDNDDIPF